MRKLLSYLQLANLRTPVCEVILLLSIFMIGGCYYIKTNAVPALIVSANVDAHQELSALMAEALGQTKLKLSTSMFTDSSIVALEQADLSGRKLSMPTRFQLMRRADQCELHQMDTEHVWRLDNVQCKPKLKVL